ncbi:uncharacterized protein LOC131234914 [Magnolia sinica]|uniref:uncharacterized protein LOC131234914 n=1 Tax=Magnolia sinica TaxID=86752 RepID=UPI0026596ACD|nr:uncharacterized protein LOC131234914 [Magnolia sinica]XP_058087900.1 uncharacterized protein LOC131234914 [Magnolia sinica]
MLGKSLALPSVTFEAAKFCSLSLSDLSTTPAVLKPKSHGIIPTVQTNVIRKSACGFVDASKKWELHSTAQPQSAVLLEDEEEKKMWDACRQALSAFKFSIEEADVILKKAFGWAHSPYWGEERSKEVPKVESVNEMLDYLQNLGLSEDDMFKVLKKFPEVLGCSLHDELKINVGTLEKVWGIEGKSLRNLLLRNPKVLGYNVDCKGDCMAKCTRCWVRF